MKVFRGRNLILRTLCLLVIGLLGFNLCACGKKESITFGTIYTSIGTDPLDVSSRIMELRSEAEEDILFYLDSYNTKWYADEHNGDIQADLGGYRLIGISEYLTDIIDPGIDKSNQDTFPFQIKTRLAS